MGQRERSHGRPGMNEYGDRLALLRSQMEQYDLQALVVPRADEYLGEYLPAHNERLRWVTGFTGSAGMAMVLRDTAAVFVDGRYTEQVKQQVDVSHFQILHLHDDPHIQWLCETLPASSRVGFDSRLHSLNWQQQAQRMLSARGHQLVETQRNLVDCCWTDRPRPEVRPAMLLSEQYSGRSSIEKRRDIAADVAGQGAAAALIFAADSLAWLLNIRGSDVPCVPVVLGFGLLYDDARLLFFCDPVKIPAGFDAHVGEGVTVLEPYAAEREFANLSGRRVLADPATANAWCQISLQRAGAKLVVADDPVALPKACKNATEVEGMRRAHRRDGTAEVRFLAWFDSEISAGRVHDEASLSDRLFGFRQEGDHFQEVAFATISAAGPNAAMAHYNHCNGVPAELVNDSVYLVDSGGQYLDGTTDITRTIAIGNPGDEVRLRFTEVLKGHIALATVRFPSGTSGMQLDALARQFLWQSGCDYDHGTGHGVGCFLSVHEGPQRISKTSSATALLPGMVVSNEPGYYKAGAYGMRCENLQVVVEVGVLAATGQPLLGFETLTLSPFDKRLLLPELLSPAERIWLNQYHERVWIELSPTLDSGDQDWLRDATAAIPD